MFNKVLEFEKLIAEYNNSPYAVSTDCCTHAIEACLRLINPVDVTVTCPSHTYISIPFTFEKLNLNWKFEYNEWHDYYYIGNTQIIDAAVFWKANSYIPNTYMCLSFQYQKHLSLGRGGMILLDKEDDYVKLKRMIYDGRDTSVPWRSQDISDIGYHYYMTIETAQLGLEKINKAINTIPRQWLVNDWPDLTTMKIFKNE